MQIASTPFLAPPPQNGYQPLSGGYSYVQARSSINLTPPEHASEAEIYTIKRQYLGLLTPQQVIDICLTFEAHAPLHIKGSVWPYDIRAAIATILAQKAQASQAQTSPESEASSKTSTLDANGASDATAPQAGSSQQQSTLGRTQVGQLANTSSASQPTMSHSQPSPAAPGPHYPHHSYYHPTYPHAPYYTPPHGTYGYPPPYPPFPQPPAMYPAGHHPPLFTSTPHSPPTSELPPSHNVDDLPSYEEMIVEALLDSGDSEGCAPKTLFNWMSSHYPLQTNFRPSASQALQKAYKRGRLEKGANGKYRLNENWEGGTTSKRTTRRPQMLAQTTVPGPQPPSSSPFTRTPLVPPPGASNVQTRLPPSGQPPGYGGYPFGYPYLGVPGSTLPSGGRDGSTTTSHKAAADAMDHEIGEGSDAWEAAQNILKAINFGQLIQISNEEDKSGEPLALANSLDQQTTVDRSDKPASASDGVVLERSTGSRLDGSGRSIEPNAEQRAALQAQFALLAAQLAELADVNGDELSQNLDVSQGTGTVSGGCTPQLSGERLGLGDASEDDDDESMVEVQVPTTSLTT